MKKILWLIMLITTCLASCNDDDNEYGANLSFSRSIYILPAVGSLEVEVRATPAPATDLVVPVRLEGSAIEEEDYEVSAHEFVIKAGQTSDTMTITPKNNITEGREIRLVLGEAEGYGLGEKKVAIIPVEAKEQIMYSFAKSSARLLSELEIWVEVQGEKTGTKFVAPSDIVIPFDILEGGTAVLGEDFEIEGGLQAITIPRGKKQTTLKVKLVEGVEDYAGKYFTLQLNPPVENSELYYAGTFKTYKCMLDQLKFSDLLGKWKPVGIINKEVFVAAAIPGEEYEGLLPEQNGPEDYLEFMQEGGVDKIKPHLTGNLTSFFGGAEHSVVFNEVRTFMDFVTWEEYDIPYFTVSGVNRLFSRSQQEIGDADIGLAVIDADNIIVYFHDYVPTDFFVPSYEIYGFEPSFFGISYQFTRVEE